MGDRLLVLLVPEYVELIGLTTIVVVEEILQPIFVVRFVIVGAVLLVVVISLELELSHEVLFRFGQLQKLRRR